MTWTKPNYDHSIPQLAASNIVPHVPVKGTAKDIVALSATNTDLSIGVTAASAAQGEPVTVYRSGVVTAIAAASLGAEAEVGVGSTNGALGLVTAASGMDKKAIGITKHAAAAGELVAVDLTFRSVQTGGG